MPIPPLLSPEDERLISRNLQEALALAPFQTLACDGDTMVLEHRVKAPQEYIRLRDIFRRYPPTRYSVVITRFSSDDLLVRFLPLGAIIPNHTGDAKG